MENIKTVGLTISYKKIKNGDFEYNLQIMLLTLRLRVAGWWHGKKQNEYQNIVKGLKPIDGVWENPRHIETIRLFESMARKHGERVNQIKLSLKAVANHG